MPTFDADGISLHYETHGASGRQMLLLHGTTGRSTSFSPLVPYLRDEATLYIPDLRGHGRSGHVPGGYRVVDFAADIASFIKGRMQKSAVIVGHSLGGLIGIALAATSPELVTGLIIEDAPLWLRRFSVRDGSERAYRFFSDLHELCVATQDEAELRARIARELPEVAARETADLPSRLATIDPDVLRMSFDNSLMDHFEIDRSLASIECPTLILQADIAQGGSLSDEDGGAALELLGRGQLIAVPGSGHAIHEDNPQQMSRLIRGWLAESGL